MSAEQPCILLVEDDAALVDALSFAFGLEGFRVRAYFMPQSLLDAAVPADADCLVVDYNLPGMDGLSLVDRLRERGVALPAILVTTQPTAQLRRDAAAREVTIIEKPLLTDDLLRQVRSVAPG
ncbi:MAG: response regulator [Caulobacteraceae bacterium]|nr:response regulator [Caulobacteraceae bacterium]